MWLPSFPSITYTSAFVVITVAAQLSNFEVDEERERTLSRDTTSTLENGEEDITVGEGQGESWNGEKRVRGTNFGVGT